MIVYNKLTSNILNPFLRTKKILTKISQTHKRKIYHKSRSVRIAFYFNNHVRQKCNRKHLHIKYVNHLVLISKKILKAIKSLLFIDISLSMSKERFNDQY